MPVAVLQSVQKRDKFVYRLTAHYNDKCTDVQDRQLPSNMSYTNYLYQICDYDQWIELNFVFVESGPTNTVSFNQLTAHSIQPDIHRIKMWYYPDYSDLHGL